MAGRPIVRLVHDDGDIFVPGDRVRLDRTLSTPPELHAIRDAQGPYAVMRCERRNASRPGTEIKGGQSDRCRVSH
jgi:hypothetical protein